MAVMVAAGTVAANHAICIDPFGSFSKLLFQKLEDIKKPRSARFFDEAMDAQLDWMPMPLNSPVAMRFSHSAGPVMWALVPPESTATVTGMSTTSNS